VKRALCSILILLLLLSSCSKELPDPIPAASEYYDNVVLNVNSQLVQDRLVNAKIAEDIEDYPQLTDLFNQFIGAYLKAFRYSFIEDATEIDKENGTAALVAEVSCVNLQALYNRLREYRQERYDEIMATGVMPSDEALQSYFYEKGIELMENDDVERIDNYQHVNMEYVEETCAWECVNGKTMIENILP